MPQRFGLEDRPRFGRDLGKGVARVQGRKAGQRRQCFQLVAGLEPDRQPVGHVVTAAPGQPGAGKIPRQHQVQDQSQDGVRAQADQNGNPQDSSQACGGTAFTGVKRCTQPGELRPARVGKFFKVAKDGVELAQLAVQLHHRSQEPTQPLAVEEVEGSIDRQRKDPPGGQATQLVQNEQHRVDNDKQG